MIETLHLFRPLQERLHELLTGLQRADWDKKTELTIPAEFAWKLFTKAVRYEQIKDRIALNRGIVPTSSGSPDDFSYHLAPISASTNLIKSSASLYTCGETRSESPRNETEIFFFFTRSFTFSTSVPLGNRRPNK